ncbi:hypothetical protein LJU39_13665 [Citrobacter freundii]|uniref:hypothetical protein n=1 Tax=Citrobacter TaxID=544 RepID=UPI00174D2EA9|nr:hypothetical protein [Citrobacter sp. Cpo032]MBY5091880.1 hypothetical protein [Citrobacter freundii]MDM2921900.1 hypothetical protein [Citrobacter sp. Cpo032]NTZ33853.1 hypothetical protein [Citrobacter freundii]UDV51280.1 hypothetical protein LJU39_13665 [Citrobacter freundii]
MSLQHKTDAELIETATKLAGYSEAGPVLKELLSRWQVQRQLADVQHQQMINLAAESELIHQHSMKQSGIVREIINLLADVAPNLTPDQQLLLSTGAEKVVPSLTLDNAVNQIKAVELVDLQSTLTCKLSESRRIQQMDALDLMALSCCIDSVLSRRLAELLYLPIGPVPVERDEIGYWTHPASALQPDWDESTPPSEIKDWFMSHALEQRVVNLEDQNDDLFDRCLENFETLKEWEPTPPDGDGWFLFSIFDSEEGVHAEFIRSIEE